jgi:cytochrome c5
MPIRARHRRRRRAPAVALLGAVAGGVFLVACSAANPPPAAPPDTTRPTPSRAPTSAEGARGIDLGIFEVSCHTGKGVTASGRPSSRETVSVDPRVLPLGTRLVIDKVGTRVAADTGGASRVGGWISGSHRWPPARGSAAGSCASGEHLADAQAARPWFVVARTSPLKLCRNCGGNDLRPLLYEEKDSSNGKDGSPAAWTILSCSPMVTAVECREL